MKSAPKKPQKQLSEQEFKDIFGDKYYFGVLILKKASIMTSLHLPFCIENCDKSGGTLEEYIPFGWQAKRE